MTSPPLLFSTALELTFDIVYTSTTLFPKNCIGRQQKNCVHLFKCKQNKIKLHVCKKFIRKSLKRLSHFCNKRSRGWSSSFNFNLIISAHCINCMINTSFLYLFYRVKNKRRTFNSGICVTSYFSRWQFLCSGAGAASRKKIPRAGAASKQDGSETLNWGDDIHHFCPFLCTMEGSNHVLL